MIYLELVKMVRPDTAIKTILVFILFGKHPHEHVGKKVINLLCISFNIYLIMGLYSKKK